MSKERKIWEVVRIVREVYNVEAETRQQALDQAENPSSVEVVRETAKRIKVEDDPRVR